MDSGSREEIVRGGGGATLSFGSGGLRRPRYKGTGFLNAQACDLQCAREGVRAVQTARQQKPGGKSD